LGTGLADSKVSSELEYYLSCLMVNMMDLIFTGKNETPLANIHIFFDYYKKI